MADNVGIRSLIDYSKLLLDKDNPRLLESQQSQRNALHSMLRKHGPDIAGLAQHIVDYGRDPSDLMKVVPLGDKAGHYVVVDGNRRLSAYRMLETPDLAPEDLSASLKRRFKKLAARFEGPPEEELCVLYPSREAAYPFIEIAHRGQQEGAGRVPWSGQAGARFDELTGKKVPHLDLLRLVTEEGNLSNDAHTRLDSFPITTLQRLIETPAAAEALGIYLKDGKIYRNFPKAEVLRGLSKVVDDLATGKQNSRKLNSQKSREAYTKGLPKKFRPAAEKRLKQAVEISDKEAKHQTDPPSPPAPDSQPPRTKMVPGNLSLPLHTKRMEQLFSEMKKVSLNTTTNVAAILLRIFLEWSVEDYIDKHNVPIGKPSKKDSQNRRLLKVAEHMEAHSHATKPQLKAVRVAASNEDSLINLETLHGYVHNTSFIPASRDVREAWDQLEEFFQLLHGSIVPPTK